MSIFRPKFCRSIRSRKANCLPVWIDLIRLPGQALRNLRLHFLKAETVFRQFMFDCFVISVWSTNCRLLKHLNTLVESRVATHRRRPAYLVLQHWLTLYIVACSRQSVDGHWPFSLRVEGTWCTGGSSTENRWDLLGYGGLMKTFLQYSPLIDSCS